MWIDDGFSQVNDLQASSEKEIKMGFLFKFHSIRRNHSLFRESLRRESDLYSKESWSAEKGEATSVRVEMVEFHNELLRAQLDFVARFVLRP